MKNKIISDSLEWNEGKVKGFFGKDFINATNGTVKLVKVAPHQKYPVHKHPDKMEYAYVVQGNPAFFIEDTLHSSEAGNFFIFPANAHHAIENNTDEDCIMIIGSIKQ
ncbi:MAG: cupin domain-containing protein [Chitinophagales bacterium]|nr:cupin domain-containing protein [Chitinophagales bacterium]